MVYSFASGVHAILGRGLPCTFEVDHVRRIFAGDVAPDQEAQAPLMNFKSHGSAVARSSDGSAVAVAVQFDTLGPSLDSGRYSAPLGSLPIPQFDLNRGSFASAASLFYHTVAGGRAANLGQDAEDLREGSFRHANQTAAQTILAGKGLKLDHSLMGPQVEAGAFGVAVASQKAQQVVDRPAYGSYQGCLRSVFGD
jgi:hypothetical protein